MTTNPEGLLPNDFQAALDGMCDKYYTSPIKHSDWILSRYDIIKAALRRCAHPTPPVGLSAAIDYVENYVKGGSKEFYDALDIVIEAAKFRAHLTPPSDGAAAVTTSPDSSKRGDAAHGDTAEAAALPEGVMSAETFATKIWPFFQVEAPYKFYEKIVQDIKARDAQLSQAKGEGWVLVPREANLGMANMGRNAADKNDSFFAVWRSMINAAPSGSSVDDAWLDIESAPKDGTKILAAQICKKSKSGYLLGGFVEICRYVSDDYTDGKWVNSSGFTQPTHWKLLPTAPQASDEV